MSDVLFILKSFLMTMALVYLMQMKVGGVTLESRFDQWIKSSEISRQSRVAAAGAALFIEESTTQMKNKVQSLWNDKVSSQRSSSSERASK